MVNINTSFIDFTSLMYPLSCWRYSFHLIFNFNTWFLEFSSFINWILCWFRFIFWCRRCLYILDRISKTKIYTFSSSYQLVSYHCQFSIEFFHFVLSDAILFSVYRIHAICFILSDSHFYVTFQCEVFRSEIHKHNEYICSQLKCY